MIDIAKLETVQGKALEYIEGVMNNPPQALAENEFNAMRVTLECAFNVIHIQPPTDPEAFFSSLRDPTPEPEPAEA